MQLDGNSTLLIALGIIALVAIVYAVVVLSCVSY